VTGPLGLSTRSVGSNPSPTGAPGTRPTTERESAACSRRARSDQRLGTWDGRLCVEWSERTRMNLNSIGIVTITSIGQRLEAYVATLVDLGSLQPIQESGATLSKAS
jgi:hypothetical protein